MNADVSSLGEGGKAGKAKESQTDKADFACCIRADVYRNHISYNYYKHSLCHGSKSNVALAMPLNPPNSLCLAPNLRGSQTSPLPKRLPLRVMAFIRRDVGGHGLR